MTTGDICCESMTKYLIVVDSLMLHEKDCDNCKEYEESDETDIYYLKCYEGVLFRNELRLLTEKIENPSKFVKSYDKYE